MSEKCLSGVKIVDLSRLLPGPFGTAILADLGAEVIKVESPSDVDFARALAGFSQALNHNKKSLSLNLKSAPGKEIFFKLVESAQVVVEQFRPGVMDRLGVGFEECRKHNPKIIYASLTGYGATGPYADKAGHDLNYISLAGIASVTGTDAGELCIPGVQTADLTGGLYLVIGILSALSYVQKNGAGLCLDVSMFESSLALIGMHLAEFFRGGEDPAPASMQLNGGIPNYRLYRTQDGRWMSLAPLEGKFWKQFCSAAGKPEWEMRLLGKKEDRDKLEQDLAGLFQGRNFSEWAKLASENPELCLEPVKKFSEVESDPQVQARGLIQKIKAGGKEYKIVRSPVRFLDQEPVAPSPAPDKGAHTEEILLSLGYGKSEIERLKKEGAV
jgi:crotonobetainyl-CoA:carnitine CoA-transferase CaiB-like acyl-CoA transferase